MNIVAHNLSAMNAQRQFGISTRSKAKSAEKLSSGYKINRAADDAAGLSISEKMRRQIRGLTQGVENTQDGVSLCQVADGALAEVNDMLHRITELSVKSANGTNTEEDREAIQEEINQILREIDRIGDTTSFNERKIFTGQTGTTVIPAEYAPVTASGFSITGTPTDTVSTNYIISADNTGFKINSDAFSWKEMIDGNGNSLADSTIVGGTYSMDFHGMKIQINADTNADMKDIVGLLNGATFSTNYKSVSTMSQISLSSFNGSMQSVTGDVTDEDFVLSVKNGGFYITSNSVSETEGYLGTSLGTQLDSMTEIPAGTYNATLSYGNAGINNTMSFDITLSDKMSKDDLFSALNGAELTHHSIYWMQSAGISGGSPLNTTGNTKIYATVQSDTLDSMGLKLGDDVPFIYLVDDSGKLALQVGTDGPIYYKADITQENFAESSIEFRDNNNNYIEFYKVSNNPSLYDLDWKNIVQNGAIQYVNITGNAEDNVHNEVFTGITLKTNATGSSNISAFEDSGYKGTMTKPPEYIYSDADLKLWIQSGAEAGQGMWLEIGRMNTTILGIDDVDVSTVEGANHAMDAVKGALQNISANRSKIGAQQNRLEHTIANEENVVENTTAAESRIRDTDMAK